MRAPESSQNLPLRLAERLGADTAKQAELHAPGRLGTGHGSAGNEAPYVERLEEVVEPLRPFKLARRHQLRIASHIAIAQAEPDNLCQPQIL